MSPFFLHQTFLIPKNAVKTPCLSNVFVTATYVEPRPSTSWKSICVMVDGGGLGGATALDWEGVGGGETQFLDSP